MSECNAVKFSRPELSPLFRTKQPIREHIIKPRENAIYGCRLNRRTSEKTGHGGNLTALLLHVLGIISKIGRLLTFTVRQ